MRVWPGNLPNDGHARQVHGVSVVLDAGPDEGAPPAGPRAVHALRGERDGTGGAATVNHGATMSTVSIHHLSRLGWKPPADGDPTVCPACRGGVCLHWPNGIPVVPPPVSATGEAPDPLPFAFVATLAPPPEHRRSSPCDTCTRVAQCEPCRQRRRKDRGEVSARRQRECRFPRARRHRALARPRSLGNQPLRVRERDDLAAASRELRAAYANRPRTVGDCRERGLGEPGNPCPWASCKHSLLIEIGEVLDPRVPPPIKDNFPGADIDDLAETCSLRVAGEGRDGPEHGDGASLERIGKLLNLTLERTRQLETDGLVKLKRHHDAGVLLAAIINRRNQ